MSQDYFEPNVKTKVAAFGMAWFWHPEAQYGCALGIIRTKVGYTGGTSKNPTYKNLGDHTETIWVEFDPEVTTYRDLLKIFWENHDSTSCSKRQYMSAIFYNDDEQRQLAEETKKEFQKKVSRSITTKIMPLEKFYDAEEYHQKYWLKKFPWLLNSLDIDLDHITDSHICTRLNGYIAGFGDMKEFEKEWPKLGMIETQAQYVRKEAARFDRSAC